MRKSIVNVLLASLLLISSMALAGELPPVTGILRTVPGNNATVGDSVQIQTSAVASTADYNIRNLISLNYDQNTDTFLTAATAIRVKVTIQRWDASNTLITPNRTEDLMVSINNRYNRQTIDRAVLKLEDGYKVKVKIDSIFINGTSTTILPRFVYIESEIHLTRYYQYSGAGVNIVGIDSLNTDCDSDDVIDELEFSWSTLTGAEEYQLEWIFVNNYGPTSGTYYNTSQLAADFKNNSTRITTTANSYRISLTYDRGYVAFRVRAVGRDYLNPDKYIYGSWSCADVLALNTIDADAIYYNWREHEKAKNWQYSVTYAEEGKKKEVVSYFDGSLHNRQSVTKVNSDKNVIVGETIYDYQGRPAINVLPTPVTFPNCTTSTEEPALMYYKKYNQNMADSSYSKVDFDKDDTLGSCYTIAPEMDTISGSSKYYSGNNADKTLQQAYVPDAELYPFSQTEYTPDNTGRIRRQSGVGKEFQLGTDHETKYFYGQPNQLQLDRLFASEAGDASHYKKNVVFDANGQASVSYLNQEGKTVATALAGNPPTDDSSVVFMEALGSASAAAKQLTVDLFNKDANGKSLLNKVTPLQDGLEFSTQLLVTYNSSYKFKYDLTIDTFADSCLRDSICISCIYELKIKVTDECGTDLTSLGTYNDSTIHKMVGHFDSIPNGYTMVCTDPSGIANADSIILDLTPGVYTVSKILTLDKDARDFYVQNYLDSTYNSCIKTIYDFTDEALDAIDTTSCYGGCDECFAALGGKDAFVSSGKGTELQYDFLYEQCVNLCKERTLCENSFEMMLVDVSPGGQYGKFDAATNTSSNKISVFNTSNLLNGNTYSGVPTHWKKPRLKLYNSEYTMYLDDNGTRKKVYVTANGSNYLPPVDNTSLVYTDTETGEKFTYPENLKDLQDFIPVWDPYFARSLVIYHPEYVYYVACSDHAKIYTADTMSSDSFDSLLIATQTFQDAVENGFIKSNYDSVAVDPNDKVVDLFDQDTAHLYDPFFTNTTYELTFSKPGGSASYAHASMVSMMTGKYDVYATKNSVNYSMIQIAAILARCGNNFYAAPTSTCDDFGTDAYSSSVPNYQQKNDSIRDKEWEFLKNFYLAEKRKVQYSRMEFYAKYYNWSANTWYGGCNACIGSNTYNVNAAGMIYPYVTGYPHSPFFNHRQPCSWYTWNNYTNNNTQKRFINPANTGLNPGNVPYQVYQQTGQCPLAFQLQEWLSGMAKDSILSSTTVTNLNTVSSFGPDLYDALNGGTIPSSYINYQWDVSTNVGGVLTVHVKNPSSGFAVCTLTVDISATAIPDFESIVSIQNLRYDTLIGSAYYFTALAEYVNGSGNTLRTTITGSSCFNIKDCVFDQECKPNPFAIDLINLVNIMKIDSLYTNANYNISTDTIISPFIATTIKNTLQAPNSNIKWNYVSSDTVELYDSLNSGRKIRLKFISYTPSYIDTSVMAYVNVRGNYDNLFKADVVDTSGTIIGIVEGKVELIDSTSTLSLSMGECDYPDAVDCDLLEHRVRKDLEKLIDEIIARKPFTGSIDLFKQVNFTSLLQSYLPDSITSTSYDYSSGTEPYYDTLVIHTNNPCDLELYHSEDQQGGESMNFNGFVGITKLTGVGEMDEKGNYYDFYCLGIFDVNPSDPTDYQTDTIWGSSCFPLKNCDACLTEGPVTLTFGTCGDPSPISNAEGYIAVMDTLSNKDECDLNYQDYLKTILAYNDFLRDSTGLGYDSIEDVYSRVCFRTALCNTADFYTAKLKAIINGYRLTPDEQGEIAVIEDFITEFYDQPLAFCEPEDSTFVFPPIPWSPNPCVQQMISVAIQNAKNTYNQYIDSVTTSISSRYTDHCLSALENFKYTYTDKEYHFTLYYYDQAGNLVKTVPPEGVELVDIDSSSETLSQKIIYDRTNNLQRVFTSHRLATTYEYNSLNQLTYQSLPDHDQMSLCESTLPLELDTNLVTNGAYFKSGRGYLTGFVTRNPPVNRGYVYTSDNEGYNWDRMYGLLGVNLRTIHFPTTVSNIGYTLGTNGMFVRSFDQGITWDLNTGLNTSPQQYFEQINDIAGAHNTCWVGGVPKPGGIGLFTGNNIHGGAPTFGPVSGVAIGDTITGIIQGSFATSRAGKIYEGNGAIASDTPSIFCVNALTKVQYLNNDTAYATGYYGTLLKSTSPISSWELMRTDASGIFRDIYFKNDSVGVALIDSVSGKAQIWLTRNGGINWTLLSTPGDYYRSFQAYETVSNSNKQVNKILALGNSGVVAKILLNSYPYGMYKITLPASTPAYNYADAQIRNNKVISMAVGNDLTYKITYNLSGSAAVWETNGAPTGTVPSSSNDDFKKVLLTATDTSTPAIKGLVLSTTGKVYSFFKSYSSSALEFGTPTNMTGTHFVDITKDTVNDIFYGFDTIGQKVFRFTFDNATSASVTGTALLNTFSDWYSSPPASSLSKSIKSIDVGENVSKIILVGNGGVIYASTAQVTEATTTVNWAVSTFKVEPLPLNNIATMTSYSSLLLVPGDNGTFWQATAAPVVGHRKFRLIPTSNKAKLNSVKTDNIGYGTGLVVGDNGTIYQLTDARAGSISLTPVTCPVTDNLIDVAIDAGASKDAYITTGSGRVLFIDDYTVSPDSIVPVVTSLRNKKGSINAVAFKAGKAFVVGDHSFMGTLINGNGAQIKDLYPHPVSIPFYDKKHGYLTNGSAVIHYTNDGGNTWQLVNPIPVGMTTIPTNSFITPISENKALIFGYKGGTGAGGLYAALIEGTNNPVLYTLPTPWWIPSGVTNRFTNISFNKSGYGVVVGLNKVVMTISPDGNGGYTFAFPNRPDTTGANFDYLSVHMFEDNNFIAAGTSGKVYYYKNGIAYAQGSTASGISSTATLNRILFVDDRIGYIVGNPGVSYRCSLSKNIGDAGAGDVANFVQWTPLCSNLALLGRSAAAVGLRALAFSSKTKGFIAGYYQTGGVNYKHALLINDESQYHSTRFFYDKLGRMVVSQNTKQFNNSPKKYSYTLYDELGRIEEVGEKTENGSGIQFKSIFGTDINNFVNMSAIDDYKLQQWIDSAGARKEVTHTYYDTSTFAGIIPITQENLRKRVSSVIYEDMYDGKDTTFQHATHYTYDIHGNVKTLVQDNKSITVTGQRFKQIDYDYDLISGKVNKVNYQPNAPDQFIHRYSYDADNRITKVETSTDDIIYQTDAKYFYYAHGPLARVEYGKNQVQGVDYAYTLQGWIKGINSNTLNAGRDMGKDGYNDASNTNKYFGRDAMGYSLGYYENDYKPIDQLKWNTVANRFEAKIVGSQMEGQRYDLHNGNISSMVTTLTQRDTTGGGLANAPVAKPIANAYKYDQANRLVKSLGFNNIDIPNNLWNSSGQAINNMYENTFAYDGNGNILKQKRYDSAGVKIEDMTYRYHFDANGKLVRNRLYHVGDVVSSGVSSTDIDDQGTFDSVPSTDLNVNNNYRYDEIGNLKRDAQEQIDTIKWTVYGKIKEIKRTAGSSKKNLKFDYDASGNRVAKHIYSSAGVWQNSIYYVRDAQGNVMSTYDNRVVSSVMSFKLDEQHLYGSSRIGMTTPQKEMIGADTTNEFLFDTLNKRKYELVNHLGSVLTTVYDRKIAVDTNSDKTVDFRLADLANASDFSPFGVILTGRGFMVDEYNAGGFNGQEKDVEILGSGNLYTAEYWEYDARLGRRWNIDPVVKPWMSSYHAFSNKPITNIDPNGASDGDYYNKEGKHLGSDGIDDNKVYVADDVKKDNKGIVTSATNAQKLDVTHTDFATSANVIKHESSGDKTESLWIAHSANNAKDNNDIDWQRKNNTLNDQLTDQGYSTTPASARLPLSTTDNSQTAMNARAAVISVQTGAADPTGGSVLWDGDDFLRQGTNHNKFNEYTNVTINADHLSTFIPANRKFKIDVKTFIKPYVNNTNFTETGNSKRYFSLQSSGQFGRSVFWKLGPK